MSFEAQFGTIGRMNWLASCLLVATAALTAAAQSALPAPSTAKDVRLVYDDPNEDLHELSLNGSRLVASPPVPGGNVETADYIREYYQMQWRGGDPLDVYVIRPKAVAKPPVTIYLYGFPASADSFRDDAFCKLMTRGGVAAIGFVPALTGERYHNLPARMWFVSELHDSIVKTVHDVQMIVSYAVSRSDLDASRIGIFGQGAGATIAGLAATVDSRIRAADLLDPWGDWPEWMAKSTLVPENERPNFLKSDYLQPLTPLDPIRWLPTLAGRPLKLDDALYETTTPAEAKAKIDASLPSGSVLVRYPTQTDYEKNALADGKLVSWIQETLLATHSGNATKSAAAHERTTEIPEIANRAQSRD